MVGTPRLALVLTQERDSGNWDPAGYEAASRMARRHGFDLEVVEGISFETSEKCFGDLATDGVDVVMGHASDYAEPLVDAARDYPGTRFATFSYITSTGDLPNVAGWMVSWNEVEFLTGVAAGLSSKTNHMGTVRGVELVPAEFALGNLIKGARHVSPDIEVTVEHIKDWHDYEGARAATERLVAAGCDVIYPAADSADAIVQGTCQDLGVLTFGEYVDEGHKYPQAIITSFMVNEAKAYDEIGEMVAADLWTPGIRTMNTETGDIRFAAFVNVPVEVSERFDSIYDDIASGRLVVSD